MKLRSALLGFIVCLLTGCSSIQYMNIDTYNPAEVTFPSDVKEILVVNNAAPQLPSSGYKLKLQGVEQDTVRVEADSALFDAARTLALSIADANYFDDVLLYHFPVREDTIAINDVKLTTEQVNQLCEETGTDAVISFDRLLFNMDKEITEHSPGLVEGKIRVDVYGILRAYLPGRDNPLASIVASDSLAWQEYVENAEFLKLLLPDAEGALRIAGSYLATQTMPNFVPHWVTENRWIFTSQNSRWKEGTTFANASKWEEAAERWRALYDASNNQQTKARLASNLALCYEMQGNFEEAHIWIKQALELFKETLGDTHRNTQLVEVYEKVISNRIQSEIKLQFQIGEQ